MATAAPAPARPSLTLTRRIKAAPAKVFRAWIDPEILARWWQPGGATLLAAEIDARVGGRYRMSFTNFSGGGSHDFGGEFLELVPDARIVHTDTFDDPNLPGTMRTSIDLRAVSCGTELKVTQEGVPAAIPPESCYLGWQESLLLLAQLVEPQIPG